MTVTFRNDIGPYSGKGSKLTSLEVDGNFYDVLTRIIDLEGGGAFGLDHIDFTGSTITFHWTDSTSSGPFMMPVATWRARGPWANDQDLLVNDIVTVTDVGIFLVLESHTTPPAPAEFDPEEVSGTDQPLYLMVGFWPDVAGYLTYRGDYAAGDYFVGDVFTDPRYGLFFVLTGHTAGATFDPTDAGLYKQLAPPRFSPVEDVEDTSDSEYELSSSDVGKYLRFSTFCTVLFRDDFDPPVGSEIHLRQSGAGAVTPMAVGETRLNQQRDGYSMATPWQGATLTAKYLGTAEWDLIGPHGDAESS